MNRLTFNRLQKKIPDTGDTESLDQKLPEILVPVADGGDIPHPDFATYRLNRPRGRFSEKTHSFGRQQL